MFTLDHGIPTTHRDRTRGGQRARRIDRASTAVAADRLVSDTVRVDRGPNTHWPRDSASTARDIVEPPGTEVDRTLIDAMLARTRCERLQRNQAAIRFIQALRDGRRHA